MKASLLTGEVQPVQELRLVGHIKDGVCRAAFKGTFENKQDHPVETSFTFPLPSGVCTTSFKVNFGGQKITSRVSKDESAKIEYDDALAQSDFAVMAQANDKNEIRIDIGALAPKEVCKIALYFVFGLTPTHNGYLMILPTSIVGIPEDLQVNLNPPPLKLRFDITDNSKIKSITTPSIDSQIDVAKGLVTSDSISMLKPIRMVITLETLVGKCLYQHFNNRLYLRMISPTPRVMRSHPSQFTILLENGLQMTSSQTSLAMRAIEFFVLSVPHGCRFNISTFGEAHRQLFECPIELTDENRKTVLDFLHGGSGENETETFENVYTKATQKIDSNAMESVIIIFGSSLNDDIQLSPDHIHFFMDTFSIGEFKELAQVKGGYYVPSDESSIISSLLSIIKMTASKPLDNAKLCIGENEITLPSFLPGDVISSYLSIEDNIEEIKQVKIKYLNVEISLPVIQSQLPILHSLWAFEKMKNSSPEEALEISIANQILTPDNASVITFERDEEVEGDVSHVDSRVSKYGVGWIGEKEEEPPKPPEQPPQPMPLPIQPPAPPHLRPRPFPFPIRPFRRIHQIRNPIRRTPRNMFKGDDVILEFSSNKNNNNGQQNQNNEQRQRAFFGTATARANPIVVNLNTFVQPQHKTVIVSKSGKKPFFLLRVMQLQNANGSWTNERNLQASCGYPIPSDSKGLKREHFVTAFIIACVRTRAPDDEDKWELVIEKALCYLINEDPQTDWDSIIENIMKELM
ncbi:VWA domain-containing protein [Histomonas meleagridis]|uniref:VWA domain-containing protein n=1 Tax=Histomonas meleagridis TaxID=135588 RepID=UPI00355A7916|nr:VWA domain-containing protein [Histomonas meleagridis]KAH0799722.1 VWA domain-containing protein [Histomonas meleagridis]